MDTVLVVPPRSESRRSFASGSPQKKRNVHDSGEDCALAYRVAVAITIKPIGHDVFTFHRRYLQEECLVVGTKEKKSRGKVERHDFDHIPEVTKFFFDRNIPKKRETSGETRKVKK